MTSATTWNTAPLAPTYAEPITHWHVCESQVGCLPEADPYVLDDPALALDMLAHLLIDWSETRPDAPETEDAARLGRAWCCCDPSSSEEPGRLDALARLEAGEDLCHIAGDRAFEIDRCAESDCLKYCPDDGCRTTVPALDTDPWCWCCGTRYVPCYGCPWLPAQD